MLTKRFKGGVLYYTLFVSIILLLMAGLFMLIFYQESFFIASLKRSERVNDYFSSGLTVALSAAEPCNKTIIVDDRANESTVQIAEEPWGMYQVATISLPQSPKESPRSYLIGISPADTIRKTGLYLRNNYSYLSIAGKTFLSGRVYLPQSGISTSSIEGTGYWSDSLIYGIKRPSKDSLPMLFKRRLQNVFKSLKEDQSFQKYSHKPVSFNSKGELYEVSHLIANQPIDGKIIVRSSQTLAISGSVKAKNAIFFAPKIVVDGSFSGACQLFATDTIIIKKGAKLHYPSGIAILSKQKGYIEVDSLSKIYGYIISVTNDCYSIGLRISPTSKVYGYLFCNARVDHRGTIFGSLYADSFEFKTSWGLYTNSLLNAQILGRELSPSYCFPMVVNGQKTVIRRLP